jgi:hypothetical protein
VRPVTGTEIHSGTARYKFLDLYRGIFVLLMLEGHIVREILAPGSIGDDLYRLHELFHGITGPGFFFGAGFTFAISSLRRWEVVTRLSAGFARRAGRSLGLVLIGYALHLPFLSLAKTLSSTTEAQWDAFLSFSVLQSIGLTLFLLSLALLILRRERLFVGFLILLLPAIVYVTPAVEQWATVASVPLAVRSAFTAETGSPYPILPFAGFVVAGVLAAWGFLQSGQRGTEHRFMIGLCALGLVAIGFAFVAERTILPAASEDLYWKVGTNFFWMRLGILLVFLSLLWIVEEHLKKAVLPDWLTILGVESFFVYIAHLPILYGWVLNPDANLCSLWSMSLSLGPALGITAAMTLLMVAGATLWRRLKKQHPVTVRALLVWAALSLVYAFLSNPF